MQPLSVAVASLTTLIGSSTLQDYERHQIATLVTSFILLLYGYFFSSQGNNYHPDALL
jgi:hypothetical protein